MTQAKFKAPCHRLGGDHVPNRRLIANELADALTRASDSSTSELDTTHT